MAGLQPFQAPFAQRRDRVSGWKLDRLPTRSALPMSSPTRIRRCSSAPPGRRTHSRRRSCARWRGMWSGRSSFPCRIRPSAPRRRRETFSPGRRTAPSSAPAAPSRRCCATVSPSANRPNEQCLCLSWRRPRRDRHEGASYLRRHVPGRGARAGRVVARQARSAGQFAAAAGRAAGISFHVAIAVARQAQMEGLADPWPEAELDRRRAGKNVGAGLRDLPAGLARYADGQFIWSITPGFDEVDALALSSLRGGIVWCGHGVSLPRRRKSSLLARLAHYW